MRWIIIVLAVAILGSAAWPASAIDSTREISSLIDALARSSCQFERNGTWYDADKAQTHLRKKYSWLRKRDLVDTAEQFIERAASRSSVSGKPYHVRCAGGPTVESADWFTWQLRRLRASPPSPERARLSSTSTTRVFQ